MRLFWNPRVVVFLLSNLYGPISSLHLDEGLQDTMFGLSQSVFLNSVPRSNDSGLGLFKRDVCADAIPGTVARTCTPGSTLCCVPSDAGIAFPQCQQILGKGFCCVSATNCYIDTVSDCSVLNSVSCTMLAAGTSQACCPPLTFCPTNFNQSTSLVRCNVIQNSQISSASTAKSSLSSSTTTTSSSTSSSVSTTTAPSTSSLTSPTIISSPSFSSTTITPSSNGSPTGLSNTLAPPTSHQLSAGAAAGIGIGAALIVLAIGGIGYWIYRRRKRTAKVDPPPENGWVLNAELPCDKPQDSSKATHGLGVYHNVNHAQYELSGDQEMPSRVPEVHNNGQS